MEVVLAERWLYASQSQNFTRWGGLDTNSTQSLTDGMPGPQSSAFWVSCCLDGRLKGALNSAISSSSTFLMCTIQGHGTWGLALCPSQDTGAYLSSSGFCIFSLFWHFNLSHFLNELLEIVKCILIVYTFLCPTSPRSTPSLDLPNALSFS